MENVVPCCFQNFIKPNVDLNDAQQVLVGNIYYLQLFCHTNDQLEE